MMSFDYTFTLVILVHLHMTEGLQVVMPAEAFAAKKRAAKQLLLS
jgi:hypothetical protein